MKSIEKKRLKDITKDDLVSMDNADELDLDQVLIISRLEIISESIRESLSFLSTNVKGLSNHELAYLIFCNINRIVYRTFLACAGNHKDSKQAFIEIVNDVADQVNREVI